MSRHILTIVTLGIGLCLLGVVPADSTPRTVEPVAAPWVAQTSPPDTLESRVVAGEALIRTLPGTTNGSPVASYRMLQGPALSGVAGRSLTWITRDIAPGTYTLCLQAQRPDAGPDTLVVRVEVQPS
jgi:hypothetical protein